MMWPARAGEGGLGTKVTHTSKLKSWNLNNLAIQIISVDKHEHIVFI